MIGRDSAEGEVASNSSAVSQEGSGHPINKEMQEEQVQPPPLVTKGSKKETNIVNEMEDVPMDDTSKSDGDTSEEETPSNSNSVVAVREKENRKRKADFPDIGNELPPETNIIPRTKTKAAKKETCDTLPPTASSSSPLQNHAKMLTSRDVRAIFLFQFQKGLKAAKAAQEINQAFKTELCDERKVQRWFTKFSEGDFELEIDTRGRSA